MLSRTPFVGAKNFSVEPNAYYESTRLVANSASGNFITSHVFRIFSDFDGEEMIAALGNGGNNAWSVSAERDSEGLQFRLQAWLDGAQSTDQGRRIPISSLWGRYMHLLISWNLGVGTTANLWINGQAYDSLNFIGSTWSIPGGSRLRFGVDTDNNHAAQSLAIQSMSFTEGGPANDAELMPYMAQSNLVGDLTDEGAPVPFNSFWSFRRSGLSGLPAVLPDLKETADDPVNGLARFGDHGNIERDVAAAEWLGYISTFAPPE